MQSLPFSSATNEQTTLVKGVSQLYSRLFGHHAVLQSELNQIQQLDGLIQSTEQCAVTATEKLKTCTEKLEFCENRMHCLSDISSSLVAAKQMCDVIIRDSGTHHKQEYMAAQRQSRSKEWEEYTAEVNHKMSEADTKYENDCQSLAKRYEEAGKKLVASHSPGLVN